MGLVERNVKACPAPVPKRHGWSWQAEALQRQLRRESRRAWSELRTDGSQPVVVRKGRENYLCLLNLEDALQGGFGGRAAILGYTRAAARELGPDNIRVNAICPNFIDTDIAAATLSPERVEALIASVPMGRLGHAHEVAGCALFLASELSSFVTGSQVAVNGGSHVH